VLLTKPIREIRLATPRARIVRIDLDGEAFPYRAGQAVMMAGHGQEKKRPYSIADAPENAERDDCLELLVGVDGDGQAGPALVLESGALVDIDGPLGRFTFPDAPTERRFLFIAGGTGISPLRAMLRHALNVPHDAIGLMFSARTPGDFAYEDEWRGLAQDRRIELKLTVTREVSEPWEGRRGRFSASDLAPLVHGRETLCFVCGPPALVQEMPQILGELGVTRDRIRVEEWG
jgi:NAD(P)H-flavin reductase